MAAVRKLVRNLRIVVVPYKKIIIEIKAIKPKADRAIKIFLYFKI